MKKRTDLMPQLKKLAATMHVTIEDDRDATSLWANADDGYSWEEGERSCCIEAYGSCGDYLPEWRQQAIADMISRLQEEPPTAVPFKY